jgi:hypothetical protein
MAATAAQIAQVRRMVGEPTTTTYSDAILTEIIERYPLLDIRGEAPWVQSAVDVTEIVANAYWIATYDLNAAAADVWDEKATAVYQNFDFTTDGQTFDRSQIFEHATKRAGYYRSRRAATTIKLRPAPRPVGVDTVSGVINAAESAGGMEL